MGWPRENRQGGEDGQGETGEGLLGAGISPTSRPWTGRLGGNKGPAFKDSGFRGPYCKKNTLVLTTAGELKERKKSRKHPITF